MKKSIKEKKGKNNKKKVNGKAVIQGRARKGQKVTKENKSKRPLNLLNKEKKVKKSANKILPSKKKLSFIEEKLTKQRKFLPKSNLKIPSAGTQAKPNVLEKKTKPETILPLKEHVPNILAEKDIFTKENVKTQNPKKQEPPSSIPKLKKEIIIDENEKNRLLKKYKPQTFSIGKSLNKQTVQILFEIKDISSLKEKISDESILNVLSCLVNKYPSFLDKICFGKTYHSETELVGHIKEETVRLLLSKLDSLKSKLSELRKKGVDVSDLTFQIMMIPLKIKIFSASFEAKDLETVGGMLDQASKEIEEVEKSYLPGSNFTG